MNDYSIVLLPERIIAASQAWFWDARWLEGERQASRDIAEGRSRRFDSDEEFLESLDRAVPTYEGTSIIERLKGQEGVLSPQIGDWRAMVDSVMIDPAYDGPTFQIALADIPERKSDLVGGTYELDLPADSTAVAVRITDMLGEEGLAVLSLDGSPDA